MTTVAEAQKAAIQLARKTKKLALKVSKLSTTEEADNYEFLLVDPNGEEVDYRGYARQYVDRESCWGPDDRNAVDIAFPENECGNVVVEAIAMYGPDRDRVWVFALECAPLEVIGRTAQDGGDTPQASAGSLYWAIRK